jgi:hypothetical protein
VVRTKCCNCVKPGSIPGCLKIILGFSSCVIEKDVKVNIMLFRTLCSTEFQGSCSRNLNLPRSENCIFEIYGP